MYTMADYKSKVHNIYFNANYAATEKMRLFGIVTYNMAEAALEEVLMPDVSDRLVNPAIAGGVDKGKLREGKEAIPLLPL